jgi:hypothetical protein
VNWTPIPYTGDSGGYTIYYSTTPGEPYEFSKTTEDKTVSQVKVTDLSENTTYYFVVKTHTESHGNNQNAVESKYSEEVLETTSEDITISGRVTISTDTDIEGLEEVTLTFSSSDKGSTETQSRVVRDSHPIKNRVYLFP